MITPGVVTASHSSPRPRGPATHTSPESVNPRATSHVRRRPLVSIVIKNRNYDAFLDDAIRSVLHQTYPGIELVIVDDGSSARSREIMARFDRDARVLFQEHRGQAAVINQGYFHTNGEIVLFLDSDDVLAPDAIDNVVTAWRPGLSLLCFRLQAVDAARAPLGFDFVPSIAGARLVDRLFRERGVFCISPTSTTLLDPQVHRL